MYLYMCIDPDPDPYLNCQGHTWQLRSEYKCLCPRYNLLMYWWNTIRLVHTFSYLRRCAVILTRLYTSKPKGMRYILRSLYTCLCRRYNLLMYLRFGGRYSRPLDCLVWLKFAASCLQCCLYSIILYQWSCFAINRFGIFT